MMMMRTTFLRMESRPFKICNNIFRLFPIPERFEMFHGTRERQESVCLGKL